MPSSRQAGSGDTWRGGWPRPLPCLCPRLSFTAPAILCLHSHFLPQYKIAKEIEKLGGALSPAQLLLHTMASWAGCWTSREESMQQQQAGAEVQAQAEVCKSLLPGSVMCYSSSQL